MRIALGSDETTPLSDLHEHGTGDTRRLSAKPFGVGEGLVRMLDAIDAARRT